MRTMSQPLPGKLIQARISPPETSTIAPVMKREASDARNSTTSDDLFRVGEAAERKLREQRILALLVAEQARRYARPASVPARWCSP